MINEPISFSERRARLRKERGLPSEEIPDTPPIPESDVPEVYEDRSESDKEIDVIIEKISILDAYVKWCNKKVDQKTLGRREGIKISCPKPEHPDNDPSAWLNLDKNVWFCGGCQEGGDVYDLAALHFGIPDYKHGKAFHELRQKIAADYGYTVETTPTGQSIVYETPEEPESLARGDESGKSDTADKADAAPAPAPEESLAPVVADITPSSGDVIDEDITMPHIPWRNIVTPNTFLWEYLEACSNDDSPEEYHFWNGLVALGSAVGRRVTLDDDPNVVANLAITLLGRTGVGKSRANRWLNEVLVEVCPFQDTGLDTSGVKQAPFPGSGEYLVEIFQHEARDPSAPKMKGAYTPVNGLVHVSEFSELLAVAGRKGSTLKPILMDFIDASHEVKMGSRTHGEVRALQPYCTLTSSTQIKSLRVLLNKMDLASGFLNRWIFVAGPYKKRRAGGGARADTQIDLTKAKEELKKVRGWGAVTRDVFYDDEAWEEWERFFHMWIEKVVHDPDMSMDIAKRIDLHLKRLMLLFCINERKELITLDIVERIETLHQYIMACYHIVDSEVGMTISEEVMDAITYVITQSKKHSKKGASLRDIRRSLHRRKYAPEMIVKALDVMQKLDMIVETKEKASGPGRPTIRYQLAGEGRTVS